MEVTLPEDRAISICVTSQLTGGRSHMVLLDFV